MTNFYNFNDEVRSILTDLYTNFSKDNASIKLYEFLEQLKLENYNIYKIIIGLSFIDNLRILNDKKNHNNLTDTEQNNLALYENIEDIDDLMFYMGENQRLLSTFMFGSIKFKSLNLKSQANLLLQVSDSYVLNFNKFYFIEKMNMFKDRTLEELVAISKRKSKEETVYEIFNILNILYLGNIKNFSKLIMDMVAVFYKWKKVLQIKKPELTFGLDDEIIALVENNSLDEIIFKLVSDSNLIEIIITDFLDYRYLDDDFKNEIEEFYSKLVSNEIKIKLKEV